MKKNRWNRYSSLREWWEDNPMHVISTILNFLLAGVIIWRFIEK